MQKRYIYAALFAIPGFFLTAILTTLLFGAVAGVLWLFILGDNPWPSYVETALPIAFILIFAAFWLMLIAAGFFLGKRLERNPQFNKSHILVSAALTLLPILFILLHQLAIGNLRLPW